MQRTGNLDGLDLELSQSTKKFDVILNKIRNKQRPGDDFIQKN